MSNQIVLGKFGSPYGVRGWVKVISYTTPFNKILDYLPWYIYKNKTKVLIASVKSKLHGDQLVVQIAQCQDRDEAKSFTNLEIYIEREQLPATNQDEIYWVDLIGLTVINQEGATLGTVERLFETGANDVVVAKEEGGKEHYIPYIKDVILDVNLTLKMIRVDWDADF